VRRASKDEDRSKVIPLAADKTNLKAKGKENKAKVPNKTTKSIEQVVKLAHSGVGEKATATPTAAKGTAASSKSVSSKPVSNPGKAALPTLPLRVNHRPSLC